MRYPFRFLLGVAVFFSLPLLPADGAGQYPGSGEATLGLEEALHAALGNNLSLANAGLEVSKAETRRRIANRERLPDVSFDASYKGQDLPESASVAIPGLAPPDSEADVALSASMPLFSEPLSAAARQAAVAVELSRESERIARGDLLLETALSFFELLASQELVVTAREALESSRLHAADVEALLEQGLVAPVDLYQSEVDLAERERDVATAEAGLIREAERLSALIFPREHVTVRAQWEPEAPVEPPPVEEWSRLAGEGSPDIAYARLALALTREGVSAAEAERLPTLGLFGAFGARDENFAYGSEDRYWNAGLGLSLPIYRGGRITLAVQQSRLTEEQAANSLDETRRLVLRRIVEARAEAVLGLKNYAAALKAIRAAEENHRVTSLKYREGLVPNRDVIDALLSLTRARYDRIQALKGYHGSRIRLMRLAGTVEEIL